MFLFQGLTACSLFEPEELQTFVLVSVNGEPLPATLFSSTGVDGRLATFEVYQGRATLFDAGRFSWEWRTGVRFDGIPDTGFPDQTSRQVGMLDEVGETLYLDRTFRGTMSANEDTLWLTDVAGTKEGARFELVRAKAR